MNLTKHWAAQIEDYVIALDWSPDGATLAAGSGSGPLLLLATEGGAQRHAFAGHDDGTNCLSYSPDGRMLASGGQDGAVKFWDPVAGQHTATAALGSAWVDHIAWRPAPKATSGSLAADGNRRAPLLAASSGRRLVMIESDGRSRHSFADAPKTLTAIAWEPSGGCVAAACFGNIRLWDADDFLLQKEFPYGNGIHTLAWSSDGRWLVSGNQDPSVHLWIPDEEVELHMSGYEGKVKHLSFDHTGRWLATSGGHDACVWDCSGAGPEGRAPAMLPHDTVVCAVAYQRAHGILATASDDGNVILWSPDRKQPLRATARLPAKPTVIAWSPDDRFLAIGSAKGVVYVLRCEL
jgi:WD40 repeat protein